MECDDQNSLAHATRSGTGIDHVPKQSLALPDFIILSDAKAQIAYFDVILNVDVAPIRHYLCSVHEVGVAALRDHETPSLWRI